MIEVIKQMAECEKNNRQYTIVALGDSVTDGCLLPGQKDFDSVYHARLKKKLNAVFPSLRINMINSGIGGINTPNSVERLDRDVFTYAPKLVIVCLGLNDICGDGELFEKSLRSILTQLHGKGIPTIYLTPNMICTYVDEKKLSGFFDRGTIDYAKKLATKQEAGSVDPIFEKAALIAKECGAEVCDCYSAWKRLFQSGVDTTNLLSNGINHPTAEMHELFASMLFTKILD